MNVGFIAKPKFSDKILVCCIWHENCTFVKIMSIKYHHLVSILLMCFVSANQENILQLVFCLFAIKKYVHILKIYMENNFK